MKMQSKKIHYKEIQTRMKNFILIVLLSGSLMAFVTTQSKLKEGYYISTNGLSPLFYEVRGSNIFWYADNSPKFYGEGVYKLNLEDSVIDVSFAKQKTSRKSSNSTSYNIQLKVKWNDAEKNFKLSDYDYAENGERLENIKKSVKAECTFNVRKALNK
jgi:hypothetical protein